MAVSFPVIFPVLKANLRGRTWIPKHISVHESIFGVLESFLRFTSWCVPVLTLLNILTKKILARNNIYIYIYLFPSLLEGCFIPILYIYIFFFCPHSKYFLDFDQQTLRKWLHLFCTLAWTGARQVAGRMGGQPKVIHLCVFSWCPGYFEGNPSRYKSHHLQGGAWHPSTA